MAKYQLTASEVVVLTEDNVEVHIPDDPENRHRIEYNKWLADGGVPDPYVPLPVEPPIPTPGEVANMRLDAGIDAAADSVTGTGKRLRQMPAHSTPPTVDELQAQVDYLAAQTQELASATLSMLQAQATTGKQKAPV